MPQPPSWLSTGSGRSRRCGQPDGWVHMGKSDVPWAPDGCTSPHTSTVPHSPVTPVATGEAETAGAQWNFVQPERTRAALTQVCPHRPGHCSSVRLFYNTVSPPPPGKKSRGGGLFPDPGSGHLMRPVRASCHPGISQSPTWYYNAALMPGEAFFTLGAQPGPHPLADRTLIENIRGSQCPSNPFHSSQH